MQPLRVDRITIAGGQKGEVHPESFNSFNQFPGSLQIGRLLNVTVGVDLVTLPHVLGGAGRRWHDNGDYAQLGIILDCRQGFQTA